MGYRLVIKAHNSERASWKRCKGRGVGKRQEPPCPLQAYATLPKGPHVHQPRSSFTAYVCFIFTSYIIICVVIILCVCGTISEKVAALCILTPVYFKPVSCQLDILFHNHDTFSKFRKIRVSSILLSTLRSVFELCQLFPMVSFVAFFFSPTQDPS